MRICRARRTDMREKFTENFNVRLYLNLTVEIKFNKSIIFFDSEEKLLSAIHMVHSPHRVIEEHKASEERVKVGAQQAVQNN